ncbi:MAG: hypothetical protein BGO05_26240 [Rhizobiales bacterium 63-7]|nr:hypothetical protein [Hyphomicrobiales bacterium]OJU67011.1 MAG: hypothetical protein BGO05_26240 [Rhizobiales bacterium 63-7]
MTGPTLEQDKRRMLRLADIVAGMGGDAWTQAFADGGCGLITRRSTGEEVTICTFTADALPGEIELLVGALDDTILFLRARARAVEVLRALQASGEAGKDAPGDQGELPMREGDFAANAAMHLNERPFWRFLAETTPGGPVDSKELADHRLKQELGIQSKSELNEKPRAQSAWIHMRGSYQLWKRNGG